MTKSNGGHESAATTFSSKAGVGARQNIYQLMHSYAASEDEAERSLFLFARGSLLARVFAIQEIYQKIINIPGMVLDIGTWRGQTAVVCENLRAIYEPLHFNRRIACFDTFQGYAGFSNKDKPTELHADGTYDVGGEDYASYLSELLKLHEMANAMGHVNGKHKVIAGDCRKTIPNFFSENPNEFIALAFFDVNSYEPTREAFEVVWDRIPRGGIVAFWQLTRDIIPAEGMVFNDLILKDYDFNLNRCATYPGLCYLVKT